MLIREAPRHTHIQLAISEKINLATENPVIFYVSLKIPGFKLSRYGSLVDTAL